MRLTTTDAIILKRRNFSEADKILTVFTPDNGKIKVLAKGIRKITSRRASCLELINHSRLSLTKTKSFPIVTEAETKSSFLEIKNDLSKLSITFMILELIDRFTEEGDQSQRVFNLLLETLKEMDKATNLNKSRLVQLSFQLKILNQSGYLPQLYDCVRCGKRLEKEANLISPSSGGLLDKSCGQSEIMTKVIDSNTVKSLRFLNDQRYSEVAKLDLTKDLIDDTSKLLNYYTSFFLERDLNSIDFATAVDKVYLPN